MIQPETDFSTPRARKKMMRFGFKFARAIRRQVLGAAGKSIFPTGFIELSESVKLRGTK